MGMHQRKVRLDSADRPRAADVHDDQVKLDTYLAGARIDGSVYRLHRVKGGFRITLDNREIAWFQKLARAVHEFEKITDAAAS